MITFPTGELKTDPNLTNDKLMLVEPGGVLKDINLEIINNQMNFPPETRILFVSDFYSGESNGSNQKPYQTINDAITAAMALTVPVSESAPVVIYCAPGEYEEDITIQDGINLVGVSANLCKIVPQTSPIDFDEDCLSLSIKGFTIDNVGGSSVSFSGSNDTLFGEKLILFENCYFTGDVEFLCANNVDFLNCYCPTLITNEVSKVRLIGGMFEDVTLGYDNSALNTPNLGNLNYVISSAIKNLTTTNITFDSKMWLQEHVVDFDVNEATDELTISTEYGDGTVMSTVLSLT
jgi:hypothetical protein